jgi:hypothetical protein
MNHLHRYGDIAGDVDREFEAKMAEVPYREVAVLRAGEAGASNVAIISYGEKPGVHAAFARDHEYKRHGT